jgi:heme/copper-type cytochrome/quinol oxidase subunit 4
LSKVAFVLKMVYFRVVRINWRTTAIHRSALSGVYFALALFFWLMRYQDDRLKNISTLTAFVLLVTAIGWFISAIQAYRKQ